MRGHRIDVSREACSTGASQWSYPRNAMEPHPLVGRRARAGAVFTGTRVGIDGLPDVLCVESDPVVKLLLCILVVVMVAVGVFGAGAVVLAVIHAKRDWQAYAWMVGLSTAAVFGAAGYCTWLIFRRRFFVRRPDGFGCHSNPGRFGAADYKWSDVEWIGIHEYRSTEEDSCSLQMKLRTARRPVTLLASGDRHALMDLLMRWSGERWHRGPSERDLPLRFDREP